MKGSSAYQFVAGDGDRFDALGLVNEVDDEPGVAVPGPDARRLSPYS